MSGNRKKYAPEYREQAVRLTAPADVLVPGDGEGRNGVWLARQGHRVTAVDSSAVGLQKARDLAATLGVTVTTVLADLGDWSPAPASVDAVVLVYTHLPDAIRRSAHQRLASSLRPGGWLLCSTFGPDTLTELRQSWAAVDDDPHVNVFIDMHDVGDRLLSAGFRDPMLDVEHYDLRYSDPKVLMRELKGIGAGNADAERARGLTGKRKLATLLAAYEGFRGDDGRYPASYEVVYAQAQAPDASQPRRRGGTDIAAVSVDSLRAQLKARRSKET